ncbi:hypothetical protein RCL_jg1743.t1 [Rhizophagus clarus]|uniref:Uncharacterized protein n=1 Tax=Rhizophagus clarus TaxID=94130 RepID=A0A8H3L7Q0_9GLOM|nr:hypothetical protein RCL_jg1743.t1 [Rhizophagus clarus]
MKDLYNVGEDKLQDFMAKEYGLKETDYGARKESARPKQSGFASRKYGSAEPSPTKIFNRDKEKITKNKQKEISKNTVSLFVKYPGNKITAGSVMLPSKEEFQKVQLERREELSSRIIEASLKVKEKMRSEEV